jgi:hypothetical protein
MLILSGCALATDTYLPDGSKGYSISCSGAALTYATCFEKAGDLCGAQGYSVVNSDGSTTPYSQIQGGYSANPNAASGGFSGSSGVIKSRSIIVKCGSVNPKPRKSKS